MNPRWTQQEKVHADHLAKQGKTNREIGVILNRTEKAVKRMIEKRGNVKRKLWNQWNEERLEQLQTLQTQLPSIKEIADALGLPYTTVQSKIYRTRKEPT